MASTVKLKEAVNCVHCGTLITTDRFKDKYGLVGSAWVYCQKCGAEQDVELEITVLVKSIRFKCMNCKKNYIAKNGVVDVGQSYSSKEEFRTWVCSACVKILDGKAIG